MDPAQIPTPAVDPSTPAAVVDPPAVDLTPPPVPTAPVDWRASLPDTLRAAPQLADVKDVNSLATQFVEQQQYLGTAIRTPGPEAAPEAWATYYAKVQEQSGGKLIARPDPEDVETMRAYASAMGVPAEAGAYTSPEIEGFDQAQFDQVKAQFHQLGLTNNQAMGLATWNHDMKAQAQADAHAALTADHALLQSEWGVTFQPRMAGIQRWLTADKAPQSVIDNVHQLPADQLKWLHSISARLNGAEGDASLIPAGQDDPNLLPPAEAISRANEIMERLSKMLPMDPEYQTLIAKRMEYLKMANPGASTDINQLRAGQVDAA